MTNSTKVKSQIKGTRLRLDPYFDSASQFEFDASEHVLLPGKTLHLGRFTDSSKVQDWVFFKSKAVSKSHAEIWLEKDGKCYIRDTKSSTGTFLNDKRLCPEHQSSKAFVLKHGDIVQLGTNYYENKKVVYYCVKIKINLNSSLKEVKSKSSSTSIKPKKKLEPKKKLGDCCFCLNKMLPEERLFFTPCSHTFHLDCCTAVFKRGFLNFKCPLCRTDIDVMKRCDELAKQNKLINNHVVLGHFNFL